MASIDSFQFPLRFEPREREFGFRFRVKGGADEVLVHAAIRLLCQIVVHGDFGEIVLGDCLIDTGTPLSVFPHSIWQRIPECCRTWLEPADDAARRIMIVTGITGHTAPARMARVNVSLRRQRFGAQAPWWSIRRNSASTRNFSTPRRNRASTV